MLKTHRQTLDERNSTPGGLSGLSTQVLVEGEGSTKGERLECEPQQLLYARKMLERKQRRAVLRSVVLSSMLIFCRAERERGDEDGVTSDNETMAR